MASNTFATGSTDATVVFPRPINHLLITVFGATSFEFSLDKGEGYIDIL